MNIEVIKKQLTGKRLQDYSYSIFFFLTFSFFLIFVIRPNLINVFSLHEELARLRLLDQNYENVIKKILDIQSFLESNRSDLYLLNQALSSRPQINRILDDINNAASQSGLTVNTMSISSINLKEISEKKDKNKVLVNLGASADFDQVLRFKTQLEKGRRLKLINNIQMNKESYATGSANLDIRLEINTYYL